MTKFASLVFSENVEVANYGMRTACLSGPYMMEGSPGEESDAHAHTFETLDPRRQSSVSRCTQREEEKGLTTRSCAPLWQGILKRTWSTTVKRSFQRIGWAV